MSARKSSDALYGINQWFLVRVVGVFVVFVIIVLLNLMSGPLTLSEVLSDGFLFRLRAERAIMAALSGACLAVAGVLTQGLFRNPLASPAVIGTTPMALLSMSLLYVLPISATSIAMGITWSVMRLGMGVFGAGLALGLLLLCSRRFRGTSLLLLGVMLGLFAAALSSLVVYLAQHSFLGLRALLSLQLGTFEAAQAGIALLSIPLFICAVIAAYNLAPALDRLLMGEEDAQLQGVDVLSVQRWSLIWISVLCGIAVSLAGSLAFVGLVVPHVLRSWVGAQHQRLIILALPVGSAAVLMADALVRSLDVHGLLPVGTVTALVGAPFFAYLLWRQQRQQERGGWHASL